MEIKENDREIFMKYAVPCGCVLVKRGSMKQEYLDSLIGSIKKGEKTPEGAEKNFKVAFAACALIAMDAGKKTIDKQVIYEYFTKNHDEVLEKRYKEMRDFDPDKCRVRAGVVAGFSGKKVIVENSSGTKKYRADYIQGLKKGDFVATHWDFAVEKISESKAREMMKIKEKLMIK